MHPAPDSYRAAGDGRERILKAALDEFAGRGFDGASTTEIARRSGVTQPLIHYHFGSKEGLWKATIDHQFGRLRDEFLAAVQKHPPTGGGARATFLALTREFVRFCGRHPQFPRMLYTELPVRSRRSEWLMATWVRPVVTQVTALHAVFARDSGMLDLPVGHLMAAVTGAAATFFALGDFMNEAYGLDPTDEATIDRHANLLAAILERGLFGAA